MILITGASDGLGHALAELYKAKSKQVIGLSRSVPKLEIERIELDLTDKKSIQKAVAEILQRPEPIEALINCAGVISVEPLDDITPEEVERVFATNVTGPMMFTSRLMKKLKKDEADIVNVASTVGTKAYPDQAAYGASKWALRGFSLNLQTELKDTKCRVISFCPGGFRSDLFEKATGQRNQDFTHWMLPEDLATFIVQILELPKTMEVSEVIINRKSIKK